MRSHKQSKLRQFREFGSEIKGGQTKRFTFLNSWVRTKQRGKSFRESYRTGYFLEVLSPRSVLWSFDIC